MTSTQTKKNLKRRMLWIIVFTLTFAVAANTVFAVGPEDIKWNKPVSMVERLTGKGPVEAIPPELEAFGVKYAGQKAMLTGYKLPEGWREAIKGAEELTLLNAGGLEHDPATVLNAEIFEKMTGVHMGLIGMRTDLIWPKYLSIAMSKSSDVEIPTLDYTIVQMPHLSAAGWLYPVDELYPPEVQELYPESLLAGLRGIDGRYYGSAVALWARFLYYRRSWLAQTGVTVPETWQDLVVASKKVDEWAKTSLGPGHVGMTYAAGYLDDLHQLFGMLTFSQDKRMVVDGKVVIDPAAWELLTDLWLKGGLSPPSLEYMWADAPEVFARGKAGFNVTGGVYMKMFADPEFGTGIQDDWGVTLLPAWEGVGIGGRAVAGNDSWGINPFISPAKKAAAMLWLDFYRSYQAQFNECYFEGNESFMPAVYDHPKVKAEAAHPDMRKVTVQAQIAEKYPPSMMDMLSTFREYLGKVVLGKLDTTSALKELQEEIDMMQ